MKPPDNEPLPDRENHRLAVLGDLTAMVAHEFNNILNNISLQLAVMEQKELPGTCDFGRCRHPASGSECHVDGEAVAAVQPAPCGPVGNGGLERGCRARGSPPA